MSAWDDKPNDYEHAIAVIERLRNELEVSEACNKAKTEALVKISIALKELSGL
jgi:hypothetical protein